MPRRTKGQHYLLTAAARSLSARAAEAVFVAIRWAETEGRPVCPRCSCPTCYDCRRPNGAPR